MKALVFSTFASYFLGMDLDGAKLGLGFVGCLVYSCWRTLYFVLAGFPFFPSLANCCHGHDLFFLVSFIRAAITGIHQKHGSIGSLALVVSLSSLPPLLLSSNSSMVLIFSLFFILHFKNSIGYSLTFSILCFFPFLCPVVLLVENISDIIDVWATVFMILCPLGLGLAAIFLGLMTHVNKLIRFLLLLIVSFYLFILSISFPL